MSDERTKKSEEERSHDGGDSRTGTAKSDRFISQRQSGKRLRSWRLGAPTFLAGGGGRAERKRLGAANRGATRNIARGPLFHPLKESWQGAQPGESVTRRNGRNGQREGRIERVEKGGGLEGGLAGYNGTKLL